MKARTQPPAAPHPPDSATAAQVDDRSAADAPVERDPLASIVRAQQGQLSAEGFWKSAGRFTKLR